MLPVYLSGMMAIAMKGDFLVISFAERVSITVQIVLPAAGNGKMANLSGDISRCRMRSFYYNAIADTCDP